jgi:hypothetical protein
MRPWDQEPDKWVVQIPRLHGRQTSDCRIGVRLSDGRIRILRVPPSREVTAEHVQVSVIRKGGEGKLIADRGVSSLSAPLIDVDVSPAPDQYRPA